MKKILILFVLNINLLIYAQESIYIDAKLAIQMIEKRDVVFIAAENMSSIIKGSKTIDSSSLFTSSILGDMPCSPLYACPLDVERQLSKLGIKRDNFLVLYDNSYGVYAATLYTILESLGHKKMTILNGGLEAVLKIDPNQKLYNKYKDKITSLSKREESSLNNIQKKLDILKPHLLVQKKNLEENKNILKDSYRLGKGNVSFLLSTYNLREEVTKVKNGDSNITIIDSCPMIDIVGNRYGSYEIGVTPLSWRKLIDIKRGKIKSKDDIDAIFSSFSKEKEYALYCMEDSNKALFMMTIMRYIGYTKVKAFTGNWSVWTRGKEK